IHGLPSLGFASSRTAMRLRPSVMNATANARNKNSRVRFQNFRKKIPDRMDAVTIMPSKNPWIIGSLAFPDQSVEKNRSGDGGSSKPVCIKVDLYRQNYKVNEYKQIGD